MTQSDWVGGTQAVLLKDLPNMRASTAIRKAELLLTLGALINKAPPAEAISTINRVREYKVAGNTRSSVPQIESAINSMERHFRVPA